MNNDNTNTNELKLGLIIAEMMKAKIEAIRNNPNLDKRKPIYLGR